MRRREFLGLLCGPTFLPIAAQAQQPIPVIGFLHEASFTDTRGQVSAFWQGMERVGFAQRNVAVEYRWAKGHHELLPSLAMDLVRRDVTVIVAGGGESSVSAAKRAAGHIPIVFVSGSDPVRSGLVASLIHPNGNATGVSVGSTELLAKRLEVLKVLVPQSTSIAALVNPKGQNIAVQLQYLTEAARRIGVPIQIANASEEADLGPALDKVTQSREDALVVANDGFLNSQLDRLVAVTTRRAIPAAFGNREFVEAGGLMSYGPSLIDAYREAGAYVGRILKGEKAADLPVQRPVNMELVINRKIAESLGLTIPPSLRANADEVVD